MDFIWVFFNESPLESSHSSMSILDRGTQSPVKKKAHMTPIPASIPNDLNAAILEVRFAEKATMVVTEVSITASPTLLIEVLHDSSIVLPLVFPPCIYGESVNYHQSPGPILVWVAG